MLLSTVLESLILELLEKPLLGNGFVQTQPPAQAFFLKNKKKSRNRGLGLN